LVGNTSQIEPSETVVHIPAHDDIIGDLDSQENMQRYINSHKEYPADYRCEKCGAQNTKDNGVIMKHSVLRRLSSVIVITFKNYPSHNVNGRKKLHYFPIVMEFESKVGTLNYRAVAKIEHSGTEGGGHYIAHCQRVVQPHIHEIRNEKYREIIKKLKANRTDSNSGDIKTYKRTLRNSETSTRSIFKMDDTRISYNTEGIKPSENTYMVFYHLM
jgi:ubiquitin C-terminal hydrolase